MLPVGAPIADLQRAGGNRRAARVGVGPGQDRRPGPNLLDRPSPTNHAAEGHHIGSVEREFLGGGHVHIADNAPGGAAVAQLNPPLLIVVPPV